MAHTPLPLNRVYLAQTVSEPAFGESADQLFYVRLADGRRSIVRQSLATGLAQVVTAEPMPAGGVGYGSGVFAVRENVLIYAAKGGTLQGLDLNTGAQWAVTPAYEGVAAPALSPCGQYVAFLAETDGRCNVLLTDVRGQSLPVKVSDDPWYAFNPVFAPDGRRLAWQEWNEFDMPWDEARLVIAAFAKPTGRTSASYQLLPLAKSGLAKPRVSYASPQFSPGGKFLAFTSDESGWRALWVAEADGQNPVLVETGPGEIGRPDWAPGQLAMRWSSDGKALYTVSRHASRSRLLRVSWPERTATELTVPFTFLDTLAVRGDQLACVASDPLTPACLITLDAGRGAAPVVRATTGIGLLDAAALSQPEVLSWATAGDAVCWGIFYPAVGPLATEAASQARSTSGAGGEQGEVDHGPRPLIVHIHGGPTSESPLAWLAQAQYFATRGWHYLVVNHRGGTGFGRAYQDQLNGQWGVVDVQDARTGAEHLIRQGRADAQRVVITGGSAGGYTTLMALTQDPGFWSAGVSLFGIGDMYELRQGSHRFEVNYEQGLIGRLPQAGRLWKERSPLTFVKAVRAPVQLFHGKEDKAVPYQQSVDFAEAVRRQGGTAELVLYEDEGHGFGKEKNRRDQLERMEHFLDKYVINLQR
ncbi:MAG: S9 family peptidase [Anaerolineales bacterium]|nr:S9 family peptidase [Anaerolineales bacterium]